MTCILKSCAHKDSNRCALLAKSGRGECGAAFALEMSKRNDGYLVVARDNPTIDGLRKAGLITTTNVGDGCVIARAVITRTRPYHYRADQWEFARAAEIGSAV